MKNLNITTIFYVMVFHFSERDVWFGKSKSLYRENNNDCEFQLSELWGRYVI